MARLDVVRPSLPPPASPGHSGAPAHALPPAVPHPPLLSCPEGSQPGDPVHLDGASPVENPKLLSSSDWRKVGAVLGSYVRGYKDAAPLDWARVAAGARGASLPGLFRAGALRQGRRCGGPCCWLRCAAPPPA
jgi:hypothetical protein